MQGYAHGAVSICSLQCGHRGSAAYCTHTSLAQGYAQGNLNFEMQFFMSLPVMYGLEMTLALGINGEGGDSVPAHKESTDNSRLL